MPGMILNPYRYAAPVSQPAFVQTLAALDEANRTSISATYTATAGNLLVVFVNPRQAEYGTISLSGGGSGGWTKHIDEGGNFSSYSGVASSGEVTLDVSWTNSASVCLIVLEYENASVEGSNGLNGTSGSTDKSISLETVNDDPLLIGAISSYFDTNGATYDTQRATTDTPDLSGSSISVSAAEKQISGPAGTYSMTYNPSNFSYYGLLIMELA